LTTGFSTSRAAAASSPALSRRTCATRPGST
jgi:hypothetical protein